MVVCTACLRSTGSPVGSKVQGLEGVCGQILMCCDVCFLVQAQQSSGIEHRARQSAAAEDSQAAAARAAKQAQRERGAAALQRSRSEASPSGRSERLPSPRVPSPSRKERRNWSPGKRDVRSSLPQTANRLSHHDRQTMMFTVSRTHPNLNQPQLNSHFAALFPLK